MFIFICGIFWIFIIGVNFLIFVEVFDFLEFTIRFLCGFAVFLVSENAF